MHILYIVQPGGKEILVELDKLYIFLRHILLLSFHYQEKENDDNPKSDNCSSCKKAKVNLCEADDSDMAEVVERRSRSEEETIIVEEEEDEDGDGGGDYVVMGMMAVSLVITMSGNMWLATN